MSVHIQAGLSLSDMGLVRSGVKNFGSNLSFKEGESILVSSSFRAGLLDLVSSAQQ